MLTKNKPELPKGKKSLLKNNKWNHANEVVAYFRSLGILVHVFNKSQSTPHLRIGKALDYWPATTRFFIYKSKLWGIGFEALKEVFTKKEKPLLNKRNNINAQIRIQQRQIELEFKQALLRDQS